MKRAWLVAAFVTAALAGCSDDAPDAGDSEEPVDGLEAMQPQWAVGDWWAFEDQNGKVYNLVVAADEGGTWALLTNDLDTAFLDWQIGISFIGTIEKNGLAGEQSTGKVRFFDFPLTDGKQWTTQWDGATRGVVAHAVDGMFQISAFAGADLTGSKFADYVYDPATGFFDSITFYNETTGEEFYRTESTGAGDGYSGEVYRYLSAGALAEYTQVGPGPSFQSVFSVDADVSELFLSWTIDCAGPGFTPLAFSPPDEGQMRPAPPLPGFGGDVYGNDQPCPNVVEPDPPIRLTQADDIAGPWRFDAAVIGNGGFEASATARTFETFSF